MIGEVSSAFLDYLGKSKLKVDWKSVTEGQKEVRSLREQNEEIQEKRELQNSREKEYPEMWSLRELKENEDSDAM